MFKEDPKQTLESIRTGNHCNYDYKEFDLVRQLIDRVVNEFEVDQLQRFALAIYDYKFELFVHLVRQSPTLVNAGNYENYTALHCAASYQPSNVPMLIHLGASLNRQTDQNMTPLDGAYWHQHETVVRVLLESGASTMIGQRTWLHGRYTVCTRLIQRSHYLSMFCRIEKLLECHVRVLVDMLSQ